MSPNWLRCCLPGWPLIVRLRAASLIENLRIWTRIGVIAGSERRVTTALRFGSDSANQQSINLPSLWPANLMVAAIQNILRTAQFLRVPSAQTMLAGWEQA